MFSTERRKEAYSRSKKQNRRVEFYVHIAAEAAVCSSLHAMLKTVVRWPKVHWRDKRMMTDEYFFTRRDNANHFVIGDGRMTGGPCQSELEQTGLRKV